MIGTLARDGRRDGLDSGLAERRWRLLGATTIGAFMAPFDGGAGVVLVARPAVTVLLSSAAGHLSDAVGSRWLAGGGMATIGAGLPVLSGPSPWTPPPGGDEPARWGERARAPSPSGRRRRVPAAPDRDDLPRRDAPIE